MTAGLTTARTVCRIIVRDLSGKFCWENSVLYSPPWCTKQSSRQSEFVGNVLCKLSFLVVCDCACQCVYMLVNKRKRVKAVEINNIFDICNPWMSFRYLKWKRAYKLLL